MARKAFALILLLVLLLWPFGPSLVGGEQPAPASPGAEGGASEVAPAGPGAESSKVVQLPEGVVAMVNGQPITEKEWADACKTVAGRQTLDSLIYYKVVEQAAAQRGISVSDEEAQVEYDKAVAEAGGLDQIWTRLADFGGSQEMFKTYLRTKALLVKLVEKQVTVSDEEVKKAYLEMYGRKAEIQVIVTQTQPDAQAALKLAREGQDFTPLVFQYSVDEMTARNHGYLPVLLADGFFPKPFNRVVITESVGKMLLDSKPGQISDVVPAGENGFYVFKVTTVQPAKDTPFDTVKEEVREAARALKTARIASEYWQQLAKSADIRVGI